jgi:hypothetical protein
MDLEKQQLEEWEVLEHEPPSSNDYLKCPTKSVGALACEIMQLIDSCEGLGFGGWDEVLAILEGGFNRRTGQGYHATDHAELARSERRVVHDDWELVC